MDLPEIRPKIESVDWAADIDLSRALNAHQRLIMEEVTRRAHEQERRIRMELLAGEPINGDVMDYRVEMLGSVTRAIACAHPLPLRITADLRIETLVHAVELWPVPLDHSRKFGVCHDQQVIFFAEQNYPRPGVQVDGLIIPDWMVNELNSLPQTTKPPIGPKDCTSCGARNLESFLRAEGKVVCHPCVEKLPTCTFCSNKVMADHYKSKARDAVACPPCMEERKAKHLAKEVPE